MWAQVQSGGLSQKQTQSSIEETFRLFPPVVLKECHFLERGRQQVGSFKLDTNNHEDLALFNLKQDERSNSRNQENKVSLKCKSCFIKVIAALMYTALSHGRRVRTRNNYFCCKRSLLKMYVETSSQMFYLVLFLFSNSTFYFHVYHRS